MVQTDMAEVLCGWGETCGFPSFFVPGVPRSDRRQDMRRNWLAGKELRNTQGGLRRRSGFSLLEVMVCLVILAIAIPAFLGAVAKNVQLEAMNNETHIALNSITRVIEDLYMLGYSQVDFDNLPQTFEATGLGNDGRLVKLTDSAASTQVGRVTITENAQNTEKVVQVSITWRSITGSDRSMSLVAEVTDY